MFESLLRLAVLNSAYARCIDADLLESWPDFFLESCIYKITTADNYRRGYEVGMVFADSRAMLKDRVAALRERDGRMDNFAAGIYLDRVREIGDGRDCLNFCVRGG
jgi:3-phenylpropionate/cinnamic acid dioxygenase small subunit